VHFRLLAASGNIYAWGRGLFGRQGSGVLQDEHLPTFVEISSEESDDEPRSSISDGYSLSTRDDARQREREREREIERANRSIFKQVAAGSYHSLALACAASPSPFSINVF
jgi:alpha-tubulin suppressor-like RCC1 family protein